jgi:RecA/RadA recombinase
MAAALPFPKSDATLAEAGWEAAVGGDTAHQTKTTISEGGIERVHQFRQFEHKVIKVTAPPSHTSDRAVARIPEVKASLETKAKEIHEISGVFRGRELTRLERRVRSGITPVDKLIGGGIVRGRISEIIGHPAAGRTSLAAAFAASITGRSEVAAWIDAEGSCDPGSIAAAGVDLARLLWVATPANPSRSGERRVDHFAGEPPQSPQATYHSDHYVADHYVADHYVEGRSSYAAKRPSGAVVLKAAEWILAAGGFGLVVIDCGRLRDGKGRVGSFTQSAALRLAHGAERSGAAVVVIAAHQMCGTFAALSLMLSRRRACFSRASSGAPALFDGLMVEARVMRNKLGGSGGAATWSALADPSCATTPEAALAPSRVQPRDSHDSREQANHAGRRVAAR